MTEKEKKLPSKKALSQFRDVRRELLILKRELRELELIRSSGYCDARLSSLLDSVKSRCSLLTEKYSGFTDYISGIDDSFDRSALTLHYLYGMTWQQVAFALGEYDEQYARRRCEKYTK